jgi:hypothetical protein
VSGLKEQLEATSSLPQATLIMGVPTTAPMGLPTTESIIDDLVLRAEVSKQLNVSERTLRSWELSSRGPPAIRIGRRVYYRAEAVRKWLLDQEGRTATSI